MAWMRLTTALFLVVALAHTSQAGSAGPTVADFVVRLAQAKSLEATNAQVAVESLHQVGVLLPTDLELSRDLTEGDVARISRALGLAVSTNRPETGFSGEQVDKFFSSFQVEMALTHGAGGPGGSAVRAPTAAFNPYTKGKGGSKGKKRGHAFTPSEPE